RELDVFWCVLRADWVSHRSVEVPSGDSRPADDARRSDLLDQLLPALPRTADPISSVGYAHRRIIVDLVALGRRPQRSEMAGGGEREHWLPRFASVGRYES